MIAPIAGGAVCGVMNAVNVRSVRSTVLLQDSPTLPSNSRSHLRLAVECGDYSTATQETHEVVYEVPL